jgi:hypothetical protein
LERQQRASFTPPKSQQIFARLRPIQVAPPYFATPDCVVRARADVAKRRMAAQRSRSQEGLATFRDSLARANPMCREYSTRMLASDKSRQVVAANWLPACARMACAFAISPQRRGAENMHRLIAPPPAEPPPPH